MIIRSEAAVSAYPTRAGRCSPAEAPLLAPGAHPRRRARSRRSPGAPSPGVLPHVPVGVLAAAQPPAVRPDRRRLPRPPIKKPAPGCSAAGGGTGPPDKRWPANFAAITSTSRSATETIVRLRAAQAAYFCDGVLLHLDKTTHLSQEPDVPATGLNPPVGTRSRRARDPGMGVRPGPHPRRTFNTTTLARLRFGDVRCGRPAADGCPGPPHRGPRPRRWPSSEPSSLPAAKPGPKTVTPLLTHAGPGDQPRHTRPAPPERSPSRCGLAHPKTSADPRGTRLRQSGTRSTSCRSAGNWDASASA